MLMEVAVRLGVGGVDISMRGRGHAKRGYQVSSVPSHWVIALSAVMSAVATPKGSRWGSNRRMACLLRAYGATQ